GQDGKPPRLVSFHDHSSPQKVLEIVRWLEEGRTVALVTDSGTPLISDPGFPLLREVIQRGIRVEALPGPSALVTALSVSGLPAESFSFFAFLPPKSASRKKKLEELRERKETLIFYEAPHRLEQVLEDMHAVFGDREAVVARELTKKFEELVRGTLTGLVEAFKQKKPQGEIVILVAGNERKRVFGEKPA
ncbi:MAG: 16S rRNA (cytidine(1402)-2'-O)-methyltransferase, partial [Candidatus Omnitrophica bacterium]|nr:16S rRNA (cytidine(1402)-2'-O)-methyltransferase [Candidatus Omnitrophota bacterium]